MTRQQRLVVLVSILASFVAFLDGSVVNVALPAIAHDLGGGLTGQQWVVDGYLITLGALILVAGSLSDMFGRKRILAAGLVGFGVTSLMCALAPSITFLMFARALQGIAGALLVPSSLALIISAFSGKAQGKAIGTWTAWTGIAFVIGPLLGGLLVDSFSWRFVFAINVLPIALTLWLLQMIEQPESLRKDERVDYLGTLLCVVGLGGTAYALIEQARYGWSSPNIYLPLIVGLGALGLFFRHESRTPQPMLPLGLFRVRNFSVGNLATLSIYGGLSVATFLITVFIQQVGGYTAIEAGLALLPITLIMFVLSPRFGMLSGKYGPRIFMALGPIVAGVGFLTMLRIGQHVNYVTELLPGVILFAFGLSATVSPLTAAVLGSIDKQEAGIGSAVNNAVARIAGLVAIAALATITGATLDVSGFHRGIGAAAILLIVGGVVSAIGITNKAVPAPAQA
jgi:EmrB/QacA subfamily drug resistance transporter